MIIASLPAPKESPHEALATLARGKGKRKDRQKAHS